MNVKNKIKKASLNFFPGDFKNMIRDDFKPKGWSNYNESPYKQYQEKMEILGYERHDKPGNCAQDS